VPPILWLQLMLDHDAPRMVDFVNHASVRRSSTSEERRTGETASSVYGKSGSVSRLSSPVPTWLVTESWSGLEGKEISYGRNIRMDESGSHGLGYGNASAVSDENQTAYELKPILHVQGTDYTSCVYASRDVYEVHENCGALLGSILMTRLSIVVICPSGNLSVGRQWALGHQATVPSPRVCPGALSLGVARPRPLICMTSHGRSHE
jgi:hypothetical protein